MSDGTITPDITGEDLVAEIHRSRGRYNRLEPFKKRYRDNATATNKWNLIRAAWAEYLPMILEGRRVSPYFLEWDFTPIEQLAWNYIRPNRMPLYPQFPVGGVFLDFADPIKRICVELDGKAYHNAERDRQRDSKLWDIRWRIFRITGSRAVKWVHEPTEPNFAADAPVGSREFNAALADWAYRTGEGVLWAINQIYYHNRCRNGQERAIALNVLEESRGIEFPLGVRESNDEADDECSTQ